jgi:hypothetical protein
MGYLSRLPSSPEVEKPFPLGKSGFPERGYLARCEVGTSDMGSAAAIRFRRMKQQNSPKRERRDERNVVDDNNKT